MDRIENDVAEWMIVVVVAERLIDASAAAAVERMN